MGRRNSSAGELLFSLKPDPKIERRANIIVAERLVARLFRNIARELGRDEAERIFKEVAKPRPKAALRKTEQQTLLDIYKTAGLPKKTFARQIAANNNFGFSYDAILMALKRRSKKR